MTKAKADTAMSHSSAGAIRTAYSGLDSHLPTINSRLYALLDQLVAIRLDLTHGAMSEAQSSASANRQLQLMVERIDAAIVATKEIVDTLETGPLGEPRRHHSRTDQATFK